MDGFWPTFLTVLLGSGAGATFVGIAFQQYQSWKAKTEDRTFIALRLAIMFERYAIDCADRVLNHSLAEETGGIMGTKLKRVPEPPELPDVESYKFLNNDLLDVVYQFPQECVMAQSDALFNVDVSGPVDSCDDALKDNTALVGFSALLIARRIRQENKLASRPLTFKGWSVDTHLETEADEAKERQAREKESMAEATKHLEKKQLAPRAP